MSVEVIDKIKPKNNANFPLVDAADIEMPDGTRLSDHDFLKSSELPKAVNVALAQAKESGEFDGKDGVDGNDGVDGKTPVKGEDYWTDADKQEFATDIMQAAAGMLLPNVTEADNGKILQVVNGAWEKVAVKDSYVATFVDDYISSALEGDY